MGILEAGYPARDYGNHRPRIAVKLYEGGLVYQEGFDYSGRNTHSWNVEEPMHKGQYVVLSEHSTPENIVVKPATKASKAIGKIIIFPVVNSGMGWTEDEQNILPRHNADWGEFVPRGATVEFFGAAIDELKVVAGNDAIEINDYLDSEANEEFEVSETATNWIALANVGALKSGFVPALAIK